MAAPIQPIGETAVIPPNPRLGQRTLRDHLENHAAPHDRVMGQAQIDIEGRPIVNSAAAYFSLRHYPHDHGDDFLQWDINVQRDRLMPILERILGMTRQQLLDNVNLGQDLIDHADEVEAAFYQVYGNPDPVSYGNGRRMKGCGHRMYA